MADRSTAPPRKPRVDAVRNHERVLEAAKAVFSAGGPEASLEAVARRAGVGIGTLYRHFPTRQHLLEAVYVDEFEAISRRADDLSSLPPWDALVAWLREFVRYAATKRALAQEMLTSIDRDAEVFHASREAITSAGDRLLGRAQAAGVARADAQWADIGRLIGGIAAAAGDDAEQVERLLDIVLDGLRAQPARA